ncbi:hypothetical protein [Rhizobium sp. 18055]|jgi:hypothetical protein|uniref:hypothetical protein n=1 Tax=Rhizobium sp. 18055 TaxID=2681403 RepID=UPI00135C2EC2|nr:hypothetical protein [Rhizobium sp. 18055]
MTEDRAMIWLAGIALGAVAPWLVKRNALIYAFRHIGVAAGILLWTLISVVTIPLMAMAIVVAREVF